MVSPLQLFPTCILTKLMHGLKVNDVWGELGIHLPQDHAPAGILFQDILDVVADCRCVGPPAPVFIQPLPHHHACNIVGRKAQSIGQDQSPCAGPGHVANPRAWAWKSPSMAGSPGRFPCHAFRNAIVRGQNTLPCHGASEGKTMHLPEHPEVFLMKQL